MNFNENCYNILRKVPRGKVTTYNALAHALKTKAYRAVGNAMNKNPYAPEVPCHRVINANGELGGYAQGIKKKIQMLKAEGIEINNNKINLDKYEHTFKEKEKINLKDLFGAWKTNKTAQELKDASRKEESP